MKRLIAVAFFATIFPIYGQEKRPQSPSHEERTKEPKQAAPQAPSTVSVINQQASNEEQNRAKSHTESYLSRLVAPENLPSIGLLLAGIWGICVAIRTLKAIESQTHILSESQRPRIVADPADDPSKTFADQEARRVVLKVVNKGLMPATEYTYESWIEVLPDTSGDFTDAADHFKCEVISVLYPDTPQRVNIPLRSGVSEADFYEVRKLRKYVCVRLYVQYKDPFVPQRRCYANFGFYLLPNGLGFLDKHNGVGYQDKKT
jgi:hypothetical protein